MTELQTWEREIIRIIDQAIDEFSSAFCGTPEQQMEALEFLANLRDSITHQKQQETVSDG